MACSTIRTWTFVKLIGAFLDLFIAYMMLCGSTIAYFASKFLGLFGLNLPCPCNGLFGNPNESYCVQRFLVEYPVGRISSVHSSVWNKFPYDLICGLEQNCQAKMNKCISFDDRPMELEGEASCSSVSDGRNPCDSAGWELVPKDAASSRIARIDLKRKGIAYQRPKSGIRRRRKVASDYGTISSAASFDPCRYDLQGTSFNFRNQINGESVAHSDFLTRKHFEGDDENVAENDWQNEIPQTSRLDLSVSKYGIDIENGSLLEKIGGSDNEERKFIFDKETHLNVLEQALKEEKAARAALYIELEKERNAAATAADEAMGMILRLQEEKASIEMQARQYQRMIEEKSAYDADELNLLKEILLRRERETYILEKEVENYKRVIQGGEQSGKGMREIQEQYGLKESSPMDNDEDPFIMLREISESIRKRENCERASKLSNSNIMPVDFVNDMSIHADHGDEGSNMHHDYEPVPETVVDLVESGDSGQRVKKLDIGEDVIIHGDADSSKHDKDTHVVDVHVVDIESSIAKLISDKSSSSTSGQNDVSPEEFVVPSNSNFNDTSFTSELDGQIEITRRHSDISSRSPPKVNLCHKEKESSMSSVDFERLKIEKEVELLRDRLKTVHEGRGKLNFSPEHSEGVKVQLQLLDDITNQLKQMQLIRSPERPAQGSDQLNPSKTEIKKRRCRSLSSGLNNSS